MKHVLSAIVAAACLSASAAVLADDASKPVRPVGKQVTVTGQVIDVACFTSMGAHGDKHKKCAEACVKAGGALGIVTSDGDVYVVIEPQPGTNPNALLMDRLEQTVTATGTAFDSHGLKTIAIVSVK